MSEFNRVIIVANGNIVEPEFCKTIIKKNDFIIAVDGGIAHLEKLKILPHLMIGDFDSIKPGLLRKYRELGINIKEFPQDKDYTDTELALIEAKKISDSVILIGAFGNRIDHTIANIYLLYEAKKMGLDMKIINKHHTIYIILEGEKKSIPGRVGDIVSIIPILPSSNITTKGLKYPLNNDVIEFGHARGISNIKVEKEAWVSVGKGSLLIFTIKKEVENENRAY